MKQRWEIRKNYLIIVLLITLLWSCKDRPQPPNVVFIYADDLGKGMISAYGQQQFRTPNIDRLIQQGISFDRAYGCMLSAPARASLLTGYHDLRTDKWNISAGGQFIHSDNDTSFIANQEQRINEKDILLSENDLYLPQVFQKAGYRTAQIGKLEWGFTATRHQMQCHGWDEYFGYLDHVRCHGYYPPFLFDNGKIVLIEGNTLPNCGKSIEPESETAYQERWNRQGKTVYSQDLFLEKMLQFIRNNKDRPFFLFHPTPLPHGPVSVTEIDPELSNNPNLTSIEKEYASMVKILDNNVGMIWNELESLGIAENTILIFAADNGHEIYYSQQGRCEKPYRNMQTQQLFDDYTNKYYSTLSGDRFNGNSGLAGLKRSNLEGGVRVPLVVYQKGKIEGGKTSQQLVAMYDWLPTFAEMLQVPLTIPKDGISFWKILQQQTAPKINRYVVFSSFWGPAIVSHDGWKLRYYQPKDTCELFQLTKDEQEKHNVLYNYPEKAEALKKQLLLECNGNWNQGVCRQ